MNHETIPLLSGSAACSGIAPSDAPTSSAKRPIQTPSWLNLVLCFVGLFMLYDAGVFTFAFLLWQGESVIEVSRYGGGFLFLRQVGAVAFLGYVLYRRRRHGDAVPSAESRWLGTLEVALLVFVSFGVSIAASISVMVMGPGFTPISHSAWTRDVYGLFDKGMTLGVLAYVLYSTSRNFSDIGLHWKAKDISMALPLGVGWFIASSFSDPLGSWAAQLLTGHPIVEPYAVAQPNGSVPGVVELFINGFHEELIVRAFLITQVRKLTGSAVLAIALSVAVQISYHFYQGAPAALGHIGWALLFSLFYWKTNRILPVVLAHNFVNFSLLLMREL